MLIFYELNPLFILNLFTLITNKIIGENGGCKFDHILILLGLKFSSYLYLYLYWIACIFVSMVHLISNINLIFFSYNKTTISMKETYHKNLLSK